MGKIYFEYGEAEINHLKACDQHLAEVIVQIGHIQRELSPDLFASLINSIVGQQISGKALATVWGRMVDMLGEVTPQSIVHCSDADLQQCGMSFRKATYIKNAAESVVEGSLNLDNLLLMTDDEVCQELVAINGIGAWTAEMLMIFSMQRSNILSYGDLAILRGMRMVYHHRKITKKLFEKYRRRYAPYGTIASFYLWEVAGGAIEGMKDYAPKQKVSKSKKKQIKK